MFEKIAVSIKTFLRDAHLTNCLQSLAENMPDAKIILTDDGGYQSPNKLELYARLKRAGNLVQALPFDSGFGKKSNVAAKMFLQESGREYLLIGADDFDFTKEAAAGVLKLQEVLDQCPDISIAGGRVNNRPYEFILEDQGSIVKQFSLWKQIDLGTNPVYSKSDKPWFYNCDLTVNYALMRRSVLERVHWDDDAKIGQGEHGAFFVDVKRAGLKVAYVPGVNINEVDIPTDPKYHQYRNRARSPYRSCFDKRGIRYYTIQGKVDYVVN